MRFMKFLDLPFYNQLQVIKKPPNPQRNFIIKISPRNIATIATFRELYYFAVGD